MEEVGIAELDTPTRVKPEFKFILFYEKTGAEFSARLFFLKVNEIKRKIIVPKNGTNIMIFTRLEFDNLYCFKNTVFDLTFPKKLVNSPLVESLPGRENFYFKRVNILSGANASGKTCFGKVLFGLQSFLSVKGRLHFGIDFRLVNAISNSEKPANITAEFVTPRNFYFHKIFLIFDKKEKSVKMQYARTIIKENENYNKALIRLNELFQGGRKPKEGEEIYIALNDNSQNEFFNQLEFFDGWYYLFTKNENKENFNASNLTSDLLFKILKTFDPSIQKVSESVTETKDQNNEIKKTLNGFLVEFQNKDAVLVDLNGEAAEKGAERFSKGTYDAIKVADFIGAIKKGGYSVYFLDEKMAYCHSEIERTILAVMIKMLPQDSQLFYTTHNCDILKMNLPVHSFSFFKKNGDYTEVIHPEKTFKKNDRSLSNAVENDVFRTLPDTSLLFDLVDERE